MQMINLLQLLFNLINIILKLLPKYPLRVVPNFKLINYSNFNKISIEKIIYSLVKISFLKNAKKEKKN